MRQTISGNINAHENFRTRFVEVHNDIEDLHYDNLSIVGLSKIIIRRATQSLFTLDKNEFYIYGEDGNRKMYSLLFNLNFTDNPGTESALYIKNVIRALDTINNLQEQ